MDNVSNTSLIQDTEIFVKKQLAGAEGGHDWWHTFRVWQNAKVISNSEAVDHIVVQLAALLHDIADSKFHDGDEELGPSLALGFLNTTNLESTKTDHIINIIRYMSFKNGIEGQEFTSPELRVVQDADRLDAIGAIGIARAFNYGGFKNRAIFDLGVLPNMNMTKEQYKNSTAPTINHFYEKLLLLKDKMNTKTGKSMADERHRFMLKYLNQFYSEVGVDEWPLP